MADDELDRLQPGPLAAVGLKHTYHVVAGETRVLQTRDVDAAPVIL
jgi:hypothetical protein